MIFVTVGSQTEFDRFIKIIDDWAGKNRDVEVICQIGGGLYKPLYARSVRRLSSIEFHAHITQCDLIVAHAGIGSIVAASDAGKPIVIFPRHADLNETRNDHQIATAKWMSGKVGVSVAWDEMELRRIMDGHIINNIKNSIEISSSVELIDNLRHYIFG